MEIGLSGMQPPLAEIVGRQEPVHRLRAMGIFTMCCEWVRNAPSIASAMGMRTRLSSAMR